MYIPRASDSSIREALNYFPVVLITGARQVGKSTLALHMEGYHYVTLDDLTLFSAAQNDPVGAIASLPKPVIIDEIQKAPNLLVAIKQYIDRHRVNGTFVLTGSANVLAFKDISDTLAGRIALFELLPFSVWERAKKQGNLADQLFSQSIETLNCANISRSSILNAVVSGGYPEMMKIDRSQGRYIWFSSYIRTYIERDVRDIGELRNLDGFIRLNQLLAIRSGNLLNKAELGNACQLDQKTLTNYLALLNLIYQVHLLRPYSSNIGKRLVKSPKLFFMDSGILSHLLNIHDLEDFNQSPYQGLLFETFVFAELYKHLSLSNQTTGFSYYRTSDKREIDFILERHGKIVAIEVKLSQSVQVSDFKHIRSLQQTQPESFRYGLVLYTGSALLPFGNGMWAVPISILF